MAAAEPMPAAELAKLVGQAADAAARAAPGGDSAPDAAQQARALDVLKLLGKATVTAALLKETDAGKRVNRLTKSSDAQVAAAAAGVVQAWKDCVKRQAAEAGGLAPSGSLLGTSRSLSLAAADSGGSGGGGGGGGKQQQRQQQGATSTSRLAGPAGAQPKQQQQQPGSGGGGRKPPPSTGDTKRDKVRSLLADGLALVPPDERGGGEPGEVAGEVEAAIYSKFGMMTGADYTAKARSIAYNLKDAANPDLRQRVISGHIDCQELVCMSPEDMASDERRQANLKIRQEAAADAVRGQSQQASTDMFKCAKCKQNKCTYYQLQTRSADEPMTTFVTCVNCNNKWKFC